MVVELTNLDIFYYVLLIIYVIFLIFFSILFFRKYKEFNKREYLSMGLMFFTIVTIYIFYIISFFMILFIKNPINPIFYIISTSLVMFFLLFWLITFGDLVLKNNKKIFLITTIILLGALEIIYYSLYFLYGQSALILSIERGLWVESTLFVILYITTLYGFFFLTAIIFLINAFKSDKKEIRLKGKILLIGLICIIIGMIFESIIPLVGLYFIFTRIFQILGVILFYIGFTLPNWAKRIFNIEISD